MLVVRSENPASRSFPTVSNLMIIQLISIFSTSDQINPMSFPDDRWEGRKEGGKERGREGKGRLEAQGLKEKEGRGKEGQEKPEIGERKGVDRGKG